MPRDEGLTVPVWFKVLSLLIGVPCLMKGLLGLLLPNRFYRWRQGQYASERPSGSLIVVPLVLIGVVAVTWYATLFHYVSWGWIVTAFVTIGAILGIVNPFR